LAWQAFLTQPQQLARDFHPQLSAAASHGRSQAQALPALIAQHDIDTLAHLANQRQGDEWVRMGAIEGLGKMGLERAESHLQLLSQPQEDDEDIRKAAFRALRRSQRLRQATTPSLKSHVGDKV
jgi:ParB family chromosome partitioning protein